MYKVSIENQNSLLEADDQPRSNYKNLSIIGSDSYPFDTESGSTRTIMPAIHIINNSIESQKNENFHRLVEIENQISKGFVVYTILIWVIMVYYLSLRLSLYQFYRL